MNINFANCTVEELWRFVAAHLERSGIGVVLVGGAVVSVHSEGAYFSGDLDFVREQFFANHDLEGVMGGIGFQKSGRHFQHPECSHLFVEFVSGPIGIGEDTRIRPQEVSEGDVTIKILSPTDCVRDRLAGFIHSGTRDHMDQAILVARRHSVDWGTIRRWARNEGPRGEEAFEELRRRVKE